jgi:hypothetical protein
MEMGMKRNAIALLALCAFAGFSASALAGEKVRSDVNVSITSTLVSSNGAIGSARNSLDNTQRIGCQLRANSVSTALSGSCDATDAFGNRAFCITSAPQLIEVIKAIGTDSYISFTYVPSATGNPTCTSVSISNSSIYEAKKP